MKPTIIVTSTAKDAVGYAHRCTDSVRAAVRQTPASVRHIYSAADEATASDALSTGGPQLEVRLSKSPALVNLLRMWSACQPTDIIVHLDGDDRLTPRALVRVLDLYRDPNVWLTYGSFTRDDGILDYVWLPSFGQRHAYDVDPRKDSFRASHLKTFRAGLVQHLITHHRDYLTSVHDGQLFDTCLDLAVMFPLLDLAGERYAVSQTVNVVYSYLHSEFAKGKRHAQTRRDDADIRARPRLPQLTERNW